MAELEFDLTLYPDPLLRKVADPVADFDDALREVVAAMFRRMYASEGVGLAAPQVGRRSRVMLVNATGKPADEIALVNPTIVSRDGAPTLFEEGCLSFPGIYAEVERPETCLVRACTPDGEAFERRFEGFESRIVQHEFDHLEGVLLVDRMSPADKLLHKGALEALVRRYQKERAGARG